MPLSPNYNPKDNENTIYQQWMDAKIGEVDYQNSPREGWQTQSDGGLSVNNEGILRDAPNDSGLKKSKTHSILMPPPNLTGDLHAGHSFQHYLMDTLSRLARQRGEQNLWFPGVDHAGLQLEGVIDKLIKKGEFDDVIIKSLSKLYNSSDNVIFDETNTLILPPHYRNSNFRMEKYKGALDSINRKYEFVNIERENLPKFLKTNFKDIWLECAWSKVNEWRDNQKNQASVLGDTPDYSRSLFTLDEQNIEMVNYAFLRYWQDGLIYKASYLVNWSVGLQTALSDVAGEIEYEKRIDPFVIFEYRLFEQNKIENTPTNAVILSKAKDPLAIQGKYQPLNKSILVGTVRPETIFGDYAVAVHPDIFDRDYSQFKDLLDQKKLFVQLPLTDRFVPVILADEVDPNFGSGALKITPANDIVDYNIFNKYIGGEFEGAIGRDGKLTELCSEYSGLKVEEGRRATIKNLVEQGFVPKKVNLNIENEGILRDAQNDNNSKRKEPKDYFGINFSENINPEDYQVNWNYEHNVTICERTKTVVEPLISEEFFISYHNEFSWTPISKDDNVSIVNRGKKTNLQKLGIEAVKKTNFHSEDYKERGVNFLEGIKDWCISRDLIWGHKMPVWYNLDTNSERKFWSCDEIMLNSPYQGAGGYLSSKKNIEEYNDKASSSFANFGYNLKPLKKLDFPFGKELITRAKEMSKNMTESEKLMWINVLSSNKTSYKWIKQHIVGNYILDFFCFELGLCVEIDGESHIENKEYDVERTSFLETLGIKVKRYSNIEVKTNIEGVYQDLMNYIKNGTLHYIQKKDLKNGIQNSNCTPQPPDRGSSTRTVNLNTHFAISPTKPTIPGNWVQEEKILDTWFSSCLWPLSTLKYKEFIENKNEKANVILVHGGEVWDSRETYRSKIENGELNLYWYNSKKNPNKTFKSNLENFCIDNKISFIKPQLPNKTNADYTKWKWVFEQSLPFITSETILVGHSLGSMFLTKYLSENKLEFKSAFLVSGGLWKATETNIPDFDCNWGISEDLELLQNYGNKINIVHSTDDEVVDYQRSLNLKEKLPNANYIELDGFGHFNCTCNELQDLIVSNFSSTNNITDFENFYPTQEMTTGKDIFYQWIVRMTMLSYYFTAEIPYTDLVITPTILDDKGKKMSKSLGNGMDPVAQIDKYSSDSMRMAMLGGMIPDRNIKMGGRLADELCEKYRNFGNKMWNIARFFEYQEEKSKEVKE